MTLRLGLLLLTLTVVFSGSLFAQNRVRTESIKPAPSGASPSAGSGTPQQIPGAPEIISDLSRVPAPVAQMRERLLAAARSGDVQKLAAVMRSQKNMPIFSVAEDKDPVIFWKKNYPDSEGIEALSILITVLESAFVHVEKGTAQEIYIWPYFARVPLKSLSLEQKVELFRIITGADYKDMVDFGAYSFYRVGIAPDGTWQFFVAGD